MFHYRMSLIFMTLFFTCIFGVYAENENKTIHCKITRSDYLFSSVFDIHDQVASMGSIVKNKFHLTTHYDAYDPIGEYEGQGVCRLFCLGAIFSWGTEIDIYNASGDKIGLIDGQFVTMGRAKFSIHDADNQCIAIAYLDKNCMGFSIVDPDNSNLILAKLNRNYVQNAVDNWDIFVFAPEQLPLAIVKIFAAFACDSQSKFKPDL